MPATDSDLSPVLQALSRLCATDALQAGEPDGAAEERFFAQGQIPLAALSVQVQGLGVLEQPVQHAQGQALHAACSPALHGRREQTLLDPQVRDTGEIAADALALHWADGALQALQADVAQALGLQALQARVHNLLVYGPGQFFKPHQDTEKHPGMVATLVLVWPSAHIGGALRVVHGRQQDGLESQHLRADALRWFAFYADCQHEVLPVQEGWRVVLTFDLVVPPLQTQAHSQPNPALLRALREQCFPCGAPSAEPWVFLLDHEYTEHGLHWHLLKGLDRPRVAALRAAAQELGLVMHLTLAEIHETWTATPRYRGRYDEAGEPEPDELIEDGMLLDFWVDADGQRLRRHALRVNLHAAESFTDTGEDYLVNEEYEGYMGNYGETLDYWYRRAALVLHTPHAEQAARFATDFDAALQDALALARSGDQAALAQRL
ncbi:MAG TPA: 2OG-Fe(II) oxygenase, partial [Alicycliphilus sp.]|nr:2OG-Fe(II) oxygenase [Alicycliphilus sp.]